MRENLKHLFDTLSREQCTFNYLEVYKSTSTHELSVLAWNGKITTGTLHNFKLFDK